MVGLLLVEALLAGEIVANSQNINVVNYIDTDKVKYQEILIPTDSRLGTGAKVGESKREEYRIQNVLSSYNQKILYKYPKTISAPVEVLDSEYTHFTEGSSLTLSYSTTKGITSTYSTQVSDSVTNSLSCEIKLESGIGVLKEENSLSSSMSINLTKTETIEDSYSSSETKEKTMSFYIDEDGTYRLERRAMFNVYIVEYVTAVYDVKKIGNNTYTSTFKYYTIDTTYILSYISGTKSIGLFKYNSSSDTGKFELDTTYAKKFFGNDYINFID